jgi:hypothetical protein
MGKAERKIIVADSLPTGLSITCSVRSCQRDISISISIAKTEGAMDMLSYICRYNYVSGASIVEVTCLRHPASASFRRYCSSEPPCGLIETNWQESRCKGHLRIRPLELASANSPRKVLTSQVEEPLSAPPVPSSAPLPIMFHRARSCISIWSPCRREFQVQRIPALSANTVSSSKRTRGCDNLGY